MNAYELGITLDIDSSIKRTLIIPKKVTFKKLHEIICILYNLNEKDKYKFIFQDIGLIIHDTGTLNRDTIDSRFELIDAYIQRYSKIRYTNSKWNINITTSNITHDKKYPEIIEIKGKYNPKTYNILPEDYLKALKIKDKKIIK